MPKVAHFGDASRVKVCVDLCITSAVMSMQLLSAAVFELSVKFTDGQES